MRTVVYTDGACSGSPARRVTRPADRQSAREAAVVFAVAAVASGVYIVVDGGRFAWFHFDEWNFLTQRTAGDLGDLFRPHVDHWSTLPILIYRLLWNLFGLHSYVPYQAVLVVMHLITAALVRTVMRRSGVGPWISTAVASVLLLFGPGRDGLVFAFNMTFVGSLMFGLIHLLLADRDDRTVDRRDVAGLAAGLAAIMFSAIGVVMVLSVGLAALIRRGWRIALFHTAPLGAIYLIWYATMGSEVGGTLDIGTLDLAGRMLSFAGDSVVAMFDAVGHYRFAGAAIAMMTVVGLFLAWRPLDLAAWRRRAAASVGLLTAWAVFALLTGYSRWFFDDGTLAQTSRYVYVGTVLALPTVGLAAAAFADRWRWSAVPVLVLLLVGAPGNVGQLEDPFWNEDFFDSQEQLVTTLAHSPEAVTAPAWVRPVLAPYPSRDITAGWLVAGAADEKIPEPAGFNPFLEADAVLRFGVALLEGSEPFGTCETIQGGLDLDLDAGDRFSIIGGIQLTRRSASPPGVVPFSTADGGAVLSVERNGLDLQVLPASGESAVTVCR